MPAKWDDASEKLMLLAMLHVQPPQNANWPQVAELMGPDFSSEAIRQKWMKTKKAAIEKWGEPAAATGDGETKKTPVKRGGKKKANDEAGNDGDTGKKSACSKRKAKKDAEDGDGQESPSKKVKIEEGVKGGDDEV